MKNISRIIPPVTVLSLQAIPLFLDKGHIVVGMLESSGSEKTNDTQRHVGQQDHAPINFSTRF